MTPNPRAQKQQKNWQVQASSYFTTEPLHNASFFLIYIYQLRVSHETEQWEAAETKCGIITPNVKKRNRTRYKRNM